MLGLQRPAQGMLSLGIVSRFPHAEESGIVENASGGTEKRCFGERCVLIISRLWSR